MSAGSGQNNLLLTSQLELLGFLIKIKYKCELEISLFSTDSAGSFPQQDIKYLESHRHLYAENNTEVPLPLTETHLPLSLSDTSCYLHAWLHLEVPNYKQRILVFSKWWQCGLLLQDFA